ncbi:MAG: hypothetical protein FWC26_03890 [Fibromonadales bacterium]|nr:hypothetical protein [Fibromonadales bacterium]
MPKYIKKYELTNQKMTLKKGLVLYRIRALRDFACVRKGDLGGWVQSEANLATDYNNAWVAGEAKVYGEARVIDDAWVSGSARVYGNALVSEQASVDGNAMVYGSATVSDCASVGENAKVYGEAQVLGNAKISGDAQVCGNARVSGHATVCEKAQIYGKSAVYDNARLFGNAEACGEAVVRYRARIGGDVKIEATSDYVTISPIGIDENLLTLTKCGMAFGAYFEMTWDELMEKCNKKDFPKLRRNQYRAAVKFAKAFF